MRLRALTHSPPLCALCAARGAAGLPQPKLFYGIPVSCNPTGVSWSDARKDAVYALACEFDFLILEDDAYFYLQFPAAPGAPPPGLRALGRSLLSRDVAGRVIRADTFSKFLAPGLRAGWLTAPPAVAARLTRCMQAAAQGANSHAQLLAARLLAAWGPAGLHAHVSTLQAAYARRAAALMAAAARHLGAAGGGGGSGGGGGDAPPLATWAAPRAGMFLWLRLGCGVTDAEALQPFLKQFKVVVVPGKCFHVDGAPSPYVRLSFASASDDDFDAGMARLAQLLRSLPPQPPASPPRGAGA
jgi:kynurenine/2-aminoadipate aminotransferase